LLFLITQLVGWLAYVATGLLLLGKAHKHTPRWGGEPSDWAKIFGLYSMIGIFGLLYLASHIFRWNAQSGENYALIILWAGLNGTMLVFFFVLSHLMRGNPMP
jgi:hypothetical protein